MKKASAFVLTLLAASAMNFTRPVLDDRQAISEARERSNQAIAARDTAAMGKYWTDDITAISSRNSEFQGRKFYQMGFAREFEAGRIFVRKPKRIEVFEPWRMASEEGNWYGEWEDRDGHVKLSGNYFAKWHKVDGKWLIRTEIFVPTNCRGGVFCSSRPF
jgi:ketosteroid isomerase-like protein